MSSRPSVPDLPLSLGQRPGLSHDARKDLGHGIAVDKHHKPRTAAASFPYTTDDQEVADVELEIDAELLKKIVNKIATPYKSRPPKQLPQEPTRHPRYETARTSVAL